RRPLGRSANKTSKRPSSRATGAGASVVLGRLGPSSPAAASNQRGPGIGGGSRRSRRAAHGTVLKTVIERQRRQESWLWDSASAVLLTMVISSLDVKATNDRRLGCGVRTITHAIRPDRMACAGNPDRTGSSGPRRAPLSVVSPGRWQNRYGRAERRTIYLDEEGHCQPTRCLGNPPAHAATLCRIHAPKPPESTSPQTPIQETLRPYLTAVQALSRSCTKQSRSIAYRIRGLSEGPYPR